MIAAFGLTLCLCPPALAGTAADEAAIEKILNDGCASFVSGEAATSVDLYLKDVTVFDIAPPRMKTHDQVVAFNKALLDAVAGHPTCVYEEIHPVILTPKYAYSWAVLYTTGKLKDGKQFAFRERSTDVWEKVAGHWRVMHEHNSVPVDVFTGTADLESKP
jgi:ketosteroid isomerase-like protein